MKRKWKIFAMLCITLALGIVFAGCPQDVEDPVFSDDAGLESITLNGGVEGTPPAAVPREEWDASSFDISSMPHEYFTLEDEAALEEVTVTVKTSQSGAKVQYGQGTNDEAPVAWNRTGEFSALSSTNVLYIAVTSESGNTRNFYKVRLILQSERTLADMARFEVNGSAVRIGNPDANPHADIAQVVPGTVWVDSVSSAPAQITTIPVNETTAITTALVKRDSSYESAEFSGTDSYVVDDGDVLYAKCVSFDGTVTRYYAGTIRIYNHISLTINGKPVEAIGQGGEAGSTANFGSVALPNADVAAGVVIKATPLANSGATITGYQISSGNPSDVSWIAPDQNGAYVRQTAIPNANYLAIRIEDKLGQTYYYRVYIQVLNSVATASAIRIGGINASLGTPQSAPWVGTNNTGTVTIPPREASPNQTTVVVSGNNGAVGSWAKAADANATPADNVFSTSPIAGGLAKDQYLFVKMVSQDGLVTQYYKILISDVKNDVVTLDSVSIDGVAASSTGTGGTAVNVAAALRGAITINSAQATQTGLVIKATPAAGSNATVTGYAVAANNATNPSFNNADGGGAFTTTAAITNNQHLFVRVQAESGTLYYYRIVVTVSNNNANLATITIGQRTATLGTPQAAPWAGSDNTGTVIIPTREASPTATSVAFTSSSGGAAASWAKAADANAIPAAGDFKTGSVSGGLTKDQYLFIKAVSSDGTVIQYYKILISDVKSDVVDLASVAIGGTSIEDGFGAGGTAVNVGTNYRGAIGIPTAAAASGTRIKATPLAGSNATITGYAVVASNQNNPSFVASDGNGEFTTTTAIANNQHLFVRVQAEIGTLYYYRIVITVR